MAMDVDAMVIDETSICALPLRKLTPEERKYCMTKGLCLCCRQSGHFAKECPNKRNWPGQANPSRYVRTAPIKTEPIQMKEINKCEKLSEIWNSMTLEEQNSFGIQDF